MAYMTGAANEIYSAEFSADFIGLTFTEAAEYVFVQCVDLNKIHFDFLNPQFFFFHKTDSKNRVLHKIS